MPDLTGPAPIPEHYTARSEIHDPQTGEHRYTVGDTVPAADVDRWGLLELKAVEPAK